MSTPSPIRVRFAPSPTGFLHVGSLRSALYNFLFTRHNKGKFLIRIEDTDKKRQIEGATEKLLKTLKDFDMESDEPVVVQSQRLDIYKKHAEQLVKNNKAYYCFCSTERLEKMRKEQQTRKEPPKYDGHCRELSREDVEKNIKESKPHIIRMRVPEQGMTEFEDIVRGKVKFENDLIDDQVLLKSDGYPTYHLASVVDDHEMKISHVIRGEEWLSSTPKHILLYKYFEWRPPEFAHLPLLLNPNKSKLSKRQGDVAVEDYLKKGYLKEALINFIAFLGWNPGTDKEAYSSNELIEDFELQKVQKAGAIFNLEKLDWLNGWYIRQLPVERLTELCLPFLIEAGFIKKTKKQKNKKTNENIVKLAQDRLKRLNEIGELVGFIFQEKLEYKSGLLIPKKSTKETTIKALEFTLSTIEQSSNRTIGNSQKLREELDSQREKQNLSRSDALWPLRVAVSGQQNSPDVFEIISALGKEKSVERIKHALNLLKK
ncbi:glutamate--tRNA ligase [Patescibacteria group bacterium]|nr:glutamate--tRNA ligase [Patescibacteria group bacterium]MBU4512962.1 glutamate--tRNA ligase [Patescibacteria group bacterium]MCG2692998.1 glutamate--tRNA ligase [Candidatus Parcubacteria bacterium]